MSLDTGFRNEDSDLAADELSISATGVSSASAASHYYVRDEKFYMESVTFLAGRTLFRPPVYALPKEDGIFAAMFELPNGDGEGSSDENPIRLPPDVTAEDFHSFLDACVPMPGGPPKLSIEEWMSVLKLSTMWCLDDLRNKAICSADQEVATLAENEDRVIDKILLGKQYRVSRWLLEGYEVLGRRDVRLSANERDRLGMASALRVWELREEYWAWTRSRPTRPSAGYMNAYAMGARVEDPVYEDRNKFDFQSAVQKIFAEELNLDPNYDPSGMAQSSTSSSSASFM
ncbi:hypothetical protein PENSPDRAFT_747885 [Peniophora sp. CONT]|nr:hypothetical protein PENSPDRAFT_747885 [Peniophora sp. CONT]